MESLRCLFVKLFLFMLTFNSQAFSFPFQKLVPLTLEFFASSRYRHTLVEMDKTRVQGIHSTFSHGSLEGSNIIRFPRHITALSSHYGEENKILESNIEEIKINTDLAKCLVSDQFPQWKDLDVCPVEPGGWDNRTFRLGKDKLLRFPSAAGYVAQVTKEHEWLPYLATKLPLIIPSPISRGKPGCGYPWQWSVYNWIPGETVASRQQINKTKLAIKLANFLLTLYDIDTTDGPLAGEHNYYRGGDVKIYERETLKSLDLLKSKFDTALYKEIWDSGAETQWKFSPVWVHGDISPDNLLTNEYGELSAVIDFGLLSIGDPACDLAIAWSYFDDESREAFHDSLGIDEDTWKRGRAWALWKALIIVSGFSNSNTKAIAFSNRIIAEIMSDFKRNG